MAPSSLIPLPEPASYRGQRALRIAARTAHIGAVGMLLGAVAFHQPVGPWPGLAIASGLVIVGDDLFKWGTLYLRMLQAWVIIAKLGLLALGVAFPNLLLLSMWGVLVLGSVVSHAPGRLRHRRLF